MVAVVVERAFARPVGLDLLARFDCEARWCLEAHGCRAIIQSVAGDGLTSLCVYEAPDAEAMRRVGEEAGAHPLPRVWSATTHFAPGVGALAIALRQGEATHGIVDRTFDAPLEFSVLQETEEKCASCLDMHRVRFVCSFLSRDKRRMACVYAAPDLEAIRSASRMTGLPFDTVRRAAAR